VTEPAHQATYGEVLAVPEFRALFASRTLAVSAATLRILAVSVLVLAATGSPLMAGLAFGIGFFPQVVGGMTLMALADRLRPRPALVLGSLLEACAAAVVALVAMPPWLLLVLLAAVATVTPVFNAAASGVLPSLLAGDRYVLGRSLMVLSSSGSQILGLGLGGAVLAVLAPREVLLVVAGLHLVAALVSRLLLADRPARVTDRSVGTVRATWRTNRALLADRAVRGQVLAQTLPASLVVGAEGLVVAYVAQVGAPASVAGILLGTFPAGMGLGNFAVGRWCPPAVRERLSLPLLLGLGAPLLLMATRPPLAVALVLLGTTAALLAYELGLQRRFLDVVPEESRGQAFGLVSTLMMFGQGLAPVAAGAVAGVWSPSTAMAVTGGSVLVSAALLARHVRVPQPSADVVSSAAAVSSGR
jgi:MFS family permease